MRTRIFRWLAATCLVVVLVGALPTGSTSPVSVAGSGIGVLGDTGPSLLW